jgi:hypothetical protein
MKVNRLSGIPLELILWITAIVLLAAADPAIHTTGNHFTLCPLANMGIKWCPGCGLGRSLTQLLHGHIQKSIHYHWLGIPALVIILYRICTLVRYQIFKENNKREEEKDYV